MGHGPAGRDALTGVGRAVAGLGALAATAALALVRLGIVGPLGAASLEDLLPTLIAVGSLCVVGLAWRDHPTVAWLATIAAVGVVTIDLATYARTVRPSVVGDAWRVLSLGVSLSALVGSGAAATYAATRTRLPRPWTAIVSLGGVVAVSAAALRALADGSAALPMSATDGSPLGSLGLVTRAFLAAVVALTAIGLIGDARPAGDRAWHRAVLTRGPVRSNRDRFAAVPAWLRAFVEELGPGRTRARSAVLAERSRLARDLHADVVPGLRRALADAERDVPPDRLAASLRELLAEVEAVGAAQHAIQLEIGGLVPALEWLAERVEERSDVTVTLDIADPSPDAAVPSPPDVAAAAFRVATLALDNVVRHAPGSRVLVGVRADAATVDLEIHDDGPGLAPEAVTSAQANGRRGIADMAAEGAACGAVVDVGVGPGGVGTRVRFAWRRG